MFLHNVGPIYFSIFMGGPLLEAQFFRKFAWKISIFFGVQTGAWASNKDFTANAISRDWSIHLLGKSTCDPPRVKTYNGQSHPYCSYLYGKINLPRIKKKTLYKQDSHICKICLPYKIPIIFLIWARFHFKEISHLELWQPLWSVEWKHLWNFGRVHHEEQFC